MPEVKRYFGARWRRRVAAGSMSCRGARSWNQPCAPDVRGRGARAL